MRSISLAIVIAVAAISAAADERPVQLKEAPGLDRVGANCAACHSLDYIIMNSPFLNAAGWDAEVAKMINAFGAPIDPADAKVISDYLKNNYSAVPERSSHEGHLSPTDTQRIIAPKTPNQRSDLGRTSDRMGPSIVPVTHHQSEQVTGKKPTLGASARTSSPGTVGGQRRATPLPVVNTRSSRLKAFQHDHQGAPQTPTNVPLAMTKPPWAGPYETCWTDDGGFRFKPCSMIGGGGGDRGGGGGGGGE